MEEAIHGMWDINELQTESDIQSDPICSSAGCTEYVNKSKSSYPMDYFVPNFGVDHDILASEADEKLASNQIGHKWTWKEAPKRAPEYTVPDFGVDEEIKYA